MAILRLSNGATYSEIDLILPVLSLLNVQLDRVKFKPDSSSDLLELDVLAAHQKRQLLELHKSQFAAIARQQAYTWCDLLVIHPGLPSLQVLISNFSRCHIHTAAESLIVLAGEAIYGFVLPDGSRIQLLVQPGDYLHIPTQVEHWFSPTASLSFKAVCYFVTPDGWVPYYTNTNFNDLLKNHSW